MVPLRHVFLKKIKLTVYSEESRATFFQNLSKVMKGVAKAYAGNFDPDLLADTADFIAAVLGSSSGKLEEDRFYSVQKVKDSVVRVDVFSVVKQITSESGTTK